MDNRTREALEEAITTAIDNGVSPTDFLSGVRYLWPEVLRERASAAEATFRSNGFRR